jgi:hypothetical protein
VNHLRALLLVLAMSSSAHALYWSDEWENKSYPEQVSRLLQVTGQLAKFDCEMPESMRSRAVEETHDRDMVLLSNEQTTKDVHGLADKRLVAVSDALRQMIVALGRENANRGRLAYPDGDEHAEAKDPMKSNALWSELRKPTGLNLDPVIEATRILSKLAGQIWGEGGKEVVEVQPPAGMAAAICSGLFSDRKCGSSYRTLQEMNCELVRIFQAPRSHRDSR